MSRLQDILACVDWKGNAEDLRVQSALVTFVPKQFLNDPNNSGVGVEIRICSEDLIEIVEWLKHLEGQS
jgi:hypothetical protein